MTDFNPVLLNSLNLIPVESVSNVQLPAQQSDFNAIFSSLFAGAQGGTGGGGSSGLGSLQKLAKLLSWDELKNLPQQGLPWQELPVEGNALPTQNWLQWFQQALAANGNSSPIDTAVNGEGTDPARKLSPLQTAFQLLNAQGAAALKTNPDGVVTEEGAEALSPQEAGILKALQAMLQKDGGAAQTQNPQTTDTARNWNALFQQATHPVGKADDAHANELLLNTRSNDPAGAAQLIPLVTPQKEFKDLLKANADSLADGMIKLAGRIGGEAGGVPFHTGLESAAKTGMDSILPRTDTTGTLTMQHPLGKPGWSTELGDKVVWMGKQEIKSAFLRLNPANLGPVEVRVSINNDQTNVSFIAHQPLAREALEASIPRLREMMDANGFNLGNVDVSGRSPQGQAGSTGYEQHAAHAQQGGHGLFAAGDEELPQAETLVQQLRVAGTAGSVDFFA